MQVKRPKKVLLIGCLSLGMMVISVVAWLYWPTIKLATPIGKRTGVYGKVVLEEGNCMPSIGAPSKSCKLYAVSRKVYFYKPLAPEAMSNVHYVGTAVPVAAAKSDRAGHYQINLPAGEYSVLAEDEGGPFCGSFSTTVACGITVTADAAQERNIAIDHATH